MVWINCALRTKRRRKNYNICELFLISEFEQHFLHIFAIIVYECITKDKVSLIPLWLHIVKSLDDIEEQPNSFSMWQIRLFSSQMLRKSNDTDDANPLLSMESMLAIKQKAGVILDKWEHGIYSCVMSINCQLFCHI
jgi:hypothetical protein